MVQQLQEQVVLLEKGKSKGRKTKASTKDDFTTPSPGTKLKAKNSAPGGPEEELVAEAVEEEEAKEGK